jgi:hypothetical protein
LLYLFPLQTKKSVEFGALRKLSDGGVAHTG